MFDGRKMSVVSFAGDIPAWINEQEKGSIGAKVNSVGAPGNSTSKDDIENAHLYFEATGNQYMKLISGAALKAKKMRK